MQTGLECDQSAGLHIACWLNQVQFKYLKKYNVVTCIIYVINVNEMKLYEFILLKSFYRQLK